MYSGLDHPILQEPLHAKVSWPATIKHGFVAFWKFLITPTGLFITIYGLNVIAWGAMLFFLLLHAAPAMDHPDNGNADSSPRKIWIEIDSQILNALFCLSSWGLAPWRFRDLVWIGLYRWTGHKRYISRLARRNESWFRMRECDYEEDSVEQALYFKRTFSGMIAPPTATWKLDFVIWMMVLNSLFQVGMAYYMWAYNRIDRPSWSTGLFIGLGCAAAMFAGIMTWWEGRKVKLIEGPKIKPKKVKGEGEDDRETEEEV
ncbi:hypothetical protein BDV97DRAFT_291767 [Delphinella strobiligena]|nr:hypothetical protein BDV97DRAFT_291767 [Delphinella strobiligena]